MVLFEPLNGFEYFADIGCLAKLVNLRPGDAAVLVNDEDGPVVDEGDFVLGGRKDAVSLGDVSVRPAVGRQRELDPSERFLKSHVGKNRVRVDAHDLGV